MYHTFFFLLFLVMFMVDLFGGFGRHWLQSLYVMESSDGNWSCFIQHPSIISQTAFFNHPYTNLQFSNLILANLTTQNSLNPSDFSSHGPNILNSIYAHYSIKIYDSITCNGMNELLWFWSLDLFYICPIHGRAVSFGKVGSIIPVICFQILILIVIYFKLQWRLKMVLF